MSIYKRRAHSAGGNEVQEIRLLGPLPAILPTACYMLNPNLFTHDAAYE